jgi:hypothetical protein
MAGATGAIARARSNLMAWFSGIEARSANKKARRPGAIASDEINQQQFCRRSGKKA